MQAWGKWIAALVVVIGLVAWWTRREPAPAPKAAAPPPIASRGAALEPIVQQPVESAVDPAELKPAPAVLPSNATPTTGRSAEDVFTEIAPSVGRVNVFDTSGSLIGTGSSVAIDDGVMLTSCHVATLGAKLAVKVGDAILPATVQLADEAFDLCRLSVPGLRAPPVTIGSVATLRTGQRVYAIGAPAGLELTISEGIVSALRRVDEGTVIQTTAPISPGSSGGGLFDLSGQLVGIMTFQHRYGQNLNFALPADWIGKMRARRASESGWRTAAVADGSQRGTPEALIIGRWLCRDWTTGKTAEYMFEIDGRLGITMADQASALKYGVAGKVLTIGDTKRAVTWAIDELTAQKMIMRGRDRSVACERP
jgi:S1-C subfamily serine protease